MKTFRINLGSMCNFSCAYCYEKNNICKNSVIEDAVLDIILDYINSNMQNNYSIIFFGGEPTLYMDKIEYFISRCLNKNINYSIFTNGSNMDKLIDIENKYNIYIGKIVSNKTNNDVYNYENIKIKQFNLILTPETIQYITDEYINYLFSRKNIEFILIVFCIESDWKNMDSELFTRVVNKLNTKYLLSWGKSNFMYLNAIDANDNYIKCCIVDILNVGTDGTIYLCNRHLNTGSPTDEGIIGNIKTDDIDVLFAKKRSVSLSYSSCQDCYYFEQLGIDRTDLMSLIDKTNLYLKDNNTNLFTIQTRCGSCSG